MVAPRLFDRELLRIGTSENALILGWCSHVRTFMQFGSFVVIRDLSVLILAQMPRLDEWHESSKSAEITGFLDGILRIIKPAGVKP